MKKQERIENTVTEYKRSFEDCKPKSWLKTIVAFANTNGGCLLFGIDDATREVIGIDFPQTVLSKISELLSSRVTPIPRYTIQETYIPSVSSPCIEVVVENGPNYPYYYVHEGTKEIYVRHGDRSEIARANLKRIKTNSHRIRTMSNSGESFFDGLKEGFARTRFQFSQDCFHLAPHFFYGIQVGAVRWKIMNVRTATFYELTDTITFMG